MYIMRLEGNFAHDLDIFRKEYSHMGVIKVEAPHD